MAITYSLPGSWKTLLEMKNFGTVGFVFQDTFNSATCFFLLIRDLLLSAQKEWNTFFNSVTCSLLLIRDLLLSAHAEQVDELQKLCEKEWMLIAEFKEGEKVCLHVS